MAHHTTWNDLLRPGTATDFFARQPFVPFDPSISAYLPGNAQWLAELCRIVYRHDREETDQPLEPTRSAFLEQAGFSTRRFFLCRPSDTQAMLVERTVSPQFAVLVFRGTEQGVADWVTNLGVVKAQWAQGPGRVHGGFLRALDSVWTEIESALDDVSTSLFYAGHSLGGALATLAGARRTPDAIYTFGSPRVGDAAFSTLCRDLPLYRIVDDRDVVPTVPPEWLGFRHEGALTTVHEGGSEEPQGGEGDGPPKFLADHAPINYVDRVGISD